MVRARSLGFGEYQITLRLWDTTDTEVYDEVTFPSIEYCPVDINGDGTVDIFEVPLAVVYNFTSISPNWNPNADINSDNIVDIYDAILLSNHFNQHYP